MTGRFVAGAWEDDPVPPQPQPFMRIDFYALEPKPGKQEITLLPLFLDVGEFGKPGTPGDEYARDCVTAILGMVRKRDREKNKAVEIEIRKVMRAVRGNS